MSYVLTFAAGIAAYPLARAAWVKYVAPRIAAFLKGPAA